jgi:hypothetical protein
MFVSVSMFPGGKKLFKRLVFGLLSVFLSIGLLNSVFNVRTIEGARTGTYYIRADSCPNPFRLVNVTLVAKDVNGVPIKNALVKAFSEDWALGCRTFSLIKQMKMVALLYLCPQETGLSSYGAVGILLIVIQVKGCF